MSEAYFKFCNCNSIFIILYAVTILNNVKFHKIKCYKKIYYSLLSFSVQCNTAYSIFMRPPICSPLKFLHKNCFFCLFSMKQTYSEKIKMIDTADLVPSINGLMTLLHESAWTWPYTIRMLSRTVKSLWKFPTSTHTSDFYTNPNKLHQHVHRVSSA